MSLVYHCCHSHCSHHFDCDTNWIVHMRPMNVHFLNYLRLAMGKVVNYFGCKNGGKLEFYLNFGAWHGMFVTRGEHIPIPRWCNIFFRFRQRGIDFAEKVFNRFSIFFFGTKYGIHIIIGRRCARRWCLCRRRLRWLSIQCWNVLGHRQR